MINTRSVTNWFPRCVTVLTLLWATSLHADHVRTKQGSRSGTVEEMSRESVRLRVGKDRVETIPANKITGIIFRNEPIEMGQARSNLANGGYLTAQRTLENATLDTKANDFLHESYAFMQVEAQARLAINGLSSARNAGRAIVAYQQDFPDSYHHYRTVETLGDLFRSMESYDRAVQQYELLGKAPWPEFKARAKLLSGLIRQQEGKHSAAIALFDKAMATRGDDKPIERQRLLSRLAKAVSLAKTDRLDAALKIIKETVRSANPEQDAGLFALAASYNALGKCYLSTGRTTDALLAFLRVDYLYSQSREIHAESLYHLVALWKQYGEPRTAKQTQDKLRRLYGDTRWSQQKN